MDIGLREWLLLIGLIVIVAILFDGWRRMSKNKRRLKGRQERPESQTVDDASTALERHREPSLGDDDLLDEQQPVPRSRQRAEPSFSADEPTHTAPRTAVSEARARTEHKAAAEPQEVLVISVISFDVNGFPGEALVQNMLENGLHFGEHDIFHRYASPTSDESVLFSMANAINPGTFDIEHMDTFSTRAVSFFLCLPGPEHPRQAFDAMVVAARSFASQLHGELRDENRSVLTMQTIEHYRQRIAEFERRRALHHR